MAGETLGTIRGQMILDVKQALAAYTQTRQQHISTVTALHTGAGAMQASGAIIAGVGAAMVAGFGVAINAAAEFERRLDFFTAVSNTTQAEYDAIREKALQLGADTIYSANQIAESFIELGKSGVNARDIIDGIGEGVAALGAAADIDLTSAANIITSAVATFQLGADQAVMVADRLAGAANASIVEVQDLGVSLKYAGGVAAALGVPFEEVNTALAILGVNGIKGSTAGTSLRQVLLSLNGVTPKARNALKELGIITEDGTNKFYNMNGSAKSLAEVFQILQDATRGMSDEQKVATFQQIFATRALPSLIALTREGAAGFAEMAAAIGETTAMGVASQRLDNLSGDLEILRGNIETLMVETGSSFQNVARFIIQGITDMLQAFMNLPQGVQTAIVGFVAFSGFALILIGTFGMLAGSVLNLIALGIQMAPVWKFLGGILQGVALFARFAAASMWSLTASMAANPLFRVVAILGLIATALIILYHNSETFRNAVQPLFDGLMNIFTALAPIVSQVFGVIVQFFQGLAGSAPGAINGVVASLGEFAALLGGVLMSAINVILPPIMELVNILIAGFMPVLQAAMPLISTFAQIIGAVLGGNLAALPGLISTAATQFTTFIEAIATSLIPAIIQVATNIIVAIIGMLPTLVEMGTQLIVSLIQGIASALPQIIGTISTLIGTLVAAIVTLLPMIIEAGLQLIMGLLNALITALPLIIQAGITLFTGLITAITTIIPMLITTITTLLPIIIQAITTALPLIITAAITLFTGLIDGIIQALPEIITALIDALIQIITAIVDALPLLIDAAIQLFLGIVLGLVQALPIIIQALVDAIPRIITALVNALPLIIDGAIQLFLGIVIGLVQALPQIIDAVIKAIPQIVNAIIAAVPKLLEAGRQLIQGLINGIGQMAGALWNAATRIAQSAIDAIKGFFGIASPSKLFTQYGVFLIQGLVNGVSNMQRSLVNTVTGLAQRVADVPFNLGMDGLYNSVASARALQAAVGSTSASLSVENTTRLTLEELRAAMEDLKIEQNIDIDVNNPEPEPASTSLPNAVRKAAYILDD